ncbi:uncharacterized protein LOC115734126 [Rhodamnia argentea]|uniref:Uncharacterized protein LOC115734126 n=1 Tax=Rhodamnia argentea TaxID=178133 RepID=A0A8B8NDQ8_9MYRT|nr:uncharacterized protein LOC115734126 [Rhodamnia argentea]
MEIVDSHNITATSIHLSAPASPDESSFEGLLFHSAPGSPKTEPPTPRASSNDGGDFQFETSRQFDDIALENPTKRQQHERREEPQPRESPRERPCMAFADELFCDGKVKPLKLPPRLQNNGGDGSRVQTPVASPTSSPRYAGVRKRLARQKSLWDDGFDPFEVALERVRAEERDSSRRRSRSMSPFRGFGGVSGDGDKVVGMRSSESTRWTLRGSAREESAEAGVRFWRAKKKVEPVEQFDPAHEKDTQTGSLEEEKQRQRKLALAEPRGADFARRLRLVKMDTHANPCKPTTTALPGPEATSTPDQGKENGGGSVNCIPRESKRQRIKKFLLRSTSLGRELGTKEKGGDGSASAEPVSKPNILRRLSFRSTGSKQSGHEVSTVGQMTLVRYRPRMLLCLGYGVQSSVHVG